MNHPPRSRQPRAGQLVALLLGVLLPGAIPAAPAQPEPGYTLHVLGDPASPRPEPTTPGLLLMGGSDWVDAAFHWFTARGGHGHFVILRASGAGELGTELHARIGGVESVQTVVFRDRRAASDPQVLDIVRLADGIFIAGGDQANYVRFWQDTPLAAALDAHVRAGKPLGGTSAGLAILGQYAYGALDGNSITTSEALADPLGSSVTLVRDFLHLPLLAHAITDTHFTQRRRLGRLVAFLARLHHEGDPEAWGLGLDESTILCVEGDGSSRLFTDRDGHAWLVLPEAEPPRLVAGEPLHWVGLRVVGIGTDSTFDLGSREVARPAFESRAEVTAGVLRLRGEPDAGTEKDRPDSPPGRQPAGSAATDAAVD